MKQQLDPCYLEDVSGAFVTTPTFEYLLQLSEVRQGSRILHGASGQGHELMKATVYTQVLFSSTVSLPSH